MAKKTNNERALDDLKRVFSEFDSPDQVTIERSVESSTRCGKCQKSVRALILEVEKGDGVQSTLDMLVKIYCMDAECDWLVEQWRPWSKSRPKDL